MYGCDDFWNRTFADAPPKATPSNLKPDSSMTSREVNENNLNDVVKVVTSALDVAQNCSDVGAKWRLLRSGIELFAGATGRFVKELQDGKVPVGEPFIDSVDSQMKSTMSVLDYKLRNRPPLLQSDSPERVVPSVVPVVDTCQDQVSGGKQLKDFYSRDINPVQGSSTTIPGYLSKYFYSEPMVSTSVVDSVFTDVDFSANQVQSSSGQPVLDEMLSFMYKREFKFGDLTFQSVGQAYQYMRLMSMGSRESILAAVVCRATGDQVDAWNNALRLAQSARNKETWEDVKRAVFFAILTVFSRQVPELPEAIERSRGWMEEFYNSHKRERKGTPDKSEVDDVVAIHGGWMARFIDDYLSEKQSFDFVPDAILACSIWPKRLDSTGSKVLLVTDWQLKGIISGASETCVIQWKCEAPPKPAEPDSHSGVKDDLLKSIKAALLHDAKLSEAYCVVLVISAQVYMSLLEHASVLEPFYRDLMWWLTIETGALIYVVNLHPFIRRPTTLCNEKHIEWADYNAMWNNTALKRVCDSYSTRVRLIDSHTMMFEITKYLTSLNENRRSDYSAHISHGSSGDRHSSYDKRRHSSRDRRRHRSRDRSERASARRHRRTSRSPRHRDSRDSKSRRESAREHHSAGSRHSSSSRHDDHADSSRREEESSSSVSVSDFLTNDCMTLNAIGRKALVCLIMKEVTVCHLCMDNIDRMDMIKLTKEISAFISKALAPSQGTITAKSESKSATSKAPHLAGVPPVAPHLVGVTPADPHFAEASPVTSHLVGVSPAQPDLAGVTSFTSQLAGLPPAVPTPLFGRGSLTASVSNPFTGVAKKSIGPLVKKLAHRYGVDVKTVVPARYTSTIVVKDKNPDEITKVGEPLGEAAIKKYKGSFDATDWRCNMCGDVNLSQKTTCLRCRAKRDEDLRTAIDRRFKDKKAAKIKTKAGQVGGLLGEDAVTRFKGLFAATDWKCFMYGFPVL